MQPKDQHSNHITLQIYSRFPRTMCQGRQKNIQNMQYIFIVNNLQIDIEILISDCKGSRTTRGKCNLCTGKRKNVRHYKEIVGNKCVRKTQVIFEECGKCLKNSRCQTKCLNHKTVQRTHFFNKLNGCFACVPSREVKSKTITCKNSRHVRDDKLTCLRHITTITERPVNCKCDRNVRKDSQVYCKFFCSKSLNYFNKVFQFTI